MELRLKAYPSGIPTECALWTTFPLSRPGCTDAGPNGLESHIDRTIGNFCRSPIQGQILLGDIDVACGKSRNAQTLDICRRSLESIPGRPGAKTC